MAYPRALQNLIESFRVLPGVGEKSAERYALCMLGEDNYTVREFSKRLIDIKEHIGYCTCCGNITDISSAEERATAICDVCKDTARDHSLICVVQSPKDILAMERAGEYKGVYFVLNGLISASKGVMPEDLLIDKLVDKAKTSREVILATPMSMDGDTTAMYIRKILEVACPELLVTRIARGLPTGGFLDYADEMTLIHALEDRKKM